MHENKTTNMSIIIQFMMVKKNRKRTKYPHHKGLLNKLVHLQTIKYYATIQNYVSI